MRARFLPLDCDHGTESALAQYCRQWVTVTRLTALGYQLQMTTKGMTAAQEPDF